MSEDALLELGRQIAIIGDDLLELKLGMSELKATALRCCATFDEWRARWIAETGPEDLKPILPVPIPKLIERLYEVVDELSDVIAHLEDAEP